jgi:hypothetical protein
MQFAANDSLLSPIIEQLAEIIEQQITPAPQKVYRKEPDGSTIHNSVTLPLNQFKVRDDTNGKLELHMIFSISHWFRRGTYGTGIESCYLYLMPYLQAFSAWPNQELQNQARIVAVSSGGVTQKVYAGEPHVALIVNVEVVTEFNIPIS